MFRLASTSVLMLCLASVACGDQQNQPAASGSAATPAKSGQAATPTKGAAGDPAIMAELAKAKGCKTNEEGLDGECKGNEAFGEFKGKYIGEDDAKMKKMAEACVAGLEDADVAVRFTAAECLEMLELTEAQKDAVIAKLESEANWGVKGALAQGLDDLTPKQSEKVVALVKKWKGDTKAGEVVSDLLLGLVPKTGEPSKDTVDLALDFAGTTDGSTYMSNALLKVAAKAPSRAADVCKKAVEIAKAKKAGWHLAVSAVNELKDACKADFDAIVDTFVAQLGDVNTVGNEFVVLKAFLANPALTKEQKGKIAKAADELAKNAKMEPTKKGAAEIAELAKK